jgi:hypothetical protein
MVYLKLKGRKKSLEGRMRPAGRTLAMSVIANTLITKTQSYINNTLQGENSREGKPFKVQQHG